MGKQIKEGTKGHLNPIKTYRDAGGGSEGVKALWSVSGDPLDIAGVRARQEGRQETAANAANMAAMQNTANQNATRWAQGIGGANSFTPTAQAPTPYDALNQQIMRNAALQMPFAGNQQFPLPPQWGQQMPPYSQNTGIVPPGAQPQITPRQPPALVPNAFQTQPTTMGMPQNLMAGLPRRQFMTR